MLGLEGNTNLIAYHFDFWIFLLILLLFCHFDILLANIYILTLTKNNIVISYGKKAR